MAWFVKNTFVSHMTTYVTWPTKKLEDVEERKSQPVQKIFVFLSAIVSENSVTKNLLKKKEEEEEKEKEEKNKHFMSSNYRWKT